LDVGYKIMQYCHKTIMAKGVNLELRLNANNKIEALWDGVSKFVSNAVSNW
jgi:hypothetical protein